MNKILFDELNYQGSNTLFLQDVQSLLTAKNIDKSILFRTSEAEKVDKIIAHGTDRYGYVPRKKWRGNNKYNTNYFHDELILASSINDIKKGELEPEFSSSFKKFNLIHSPLLLIYDLSFFKHLEEKSYLFKNQHKKPNSLLAVIRVKKRQTEGWFSEEEGLFYRSLCEKIKKGTVVEVGAWKGLSSSYISTICKINGSDIYLVDHWAGSTDKYHQLYLREIIRHGKNNIIGSVRQACPNSNIIDLPSNEAAKKFASHSIDLVFIDASHDYQSVFSDILIWSEKVKAGGYICGHDYNFKHKGVIKAVNNFSQKTGYKLNLGPGSIWYLNK